MKVRLLTPGLFWFGAEMFEVVIFAVPAHLHRGYALDSALGYDVNDQALVPAWWVAI